jgi:hypothetical protein
MVLKPGSTPFASRSPTMFAVTLEDARWKNAYVNHLVNVVDGYAALYNLQATSDSLSYFPYVESLALANTKRNHSTTHFCLFPISGISYVNKYREE